MVAATRPDVVHRHDWYADESLRYLGSGDEHWPAEWRPVRSMVVHHTKTRNDDHDPVERVQRIYRFHAIERDWGDIGYHFLIDESGVVFEGRIGSAGLLDGGPAVIGAHVYGHNRGSVGIGLLGTFEEQPPTEPAWESLVGLMAWISQQHQLEPLGLLDGAERIPTITGHRDLGSTTCPGAACYDRLPELRRDVAAVLRETVGK